MHPQHPPSRRITRPCSAALLAAAGLVLPFTAACLDEGAPARATTRRAGLDRPRPSSTEGSSRLGVTDRWDVVLRDDFERVELGPNWRALSKAWRIIDGELCIRGAKNRGAWLVPPLPTRSRISFDARADSSDGDIKVELWGDGRSGAQTATYDHATGYVAILGGWRNTRHVLARLDEHGADRLSRVVAEQPSSPFASPVVIGQRYRFAFERGDDMVLRWYVDGTLVFELTDPRPLEGTGHEHFAFNDWTAPVCFDNLVVARLLP